MDGRAGRLPEHHEVGQAGGIGALRLALARDTGTTGPLCLRGVFTAMWPRMISGYSGQGRTADGLPTHEHRDAENQDHQHRHAAADQRWADTSGTRRP